MSVFFRLCVNQGDRIPDESLPRPSISAWPSRWVPAYSNVTLQCSAPTRGVNFVFRKGSYPLESLRFSDSPEGLGEFHLTDLPQSSAGKYSCEYYTKMSPTRRSPSSDVLLLVVTGHLPKPSLQAHQGGKVTTGGNVILRCQMPDHVIQFYKFALLKKGTSTPIQLQGPVKKQTDFSLRSVTVDDTGNYSCVYYETQAPFYASEPSDQFEIWVTGTRESPERAGTPLGTTEIILAVILTLLFLLAAFLVYRYICRGAAFNKMTKRSRPPKKPEEVVTDASPATPSRSPVRDEGSQEPRREERHGVTYAELNTRALSEGPSNQMKQPLETCVYSVLKT